MLVMSRKINESIVIGNLLITVVRVHGAKVRLDVTLRPPLDPAWLTWQDGIVPRLARRIAETKDYTTLPILGDALEEAGCADAFVLGHCWSTNPAFRQSWVVELILSASGPRPGIATFLTSS